MTTPLTKAVLYKLKDSQPAGKGKPPNVKVDGDPITVQFNPTSLRIQRQNNIDQGGTTTRTQARQNPSAQSATLTLDLEFDTAEGDGSGQPLDVRERTKDVRQFVEPNRNKPSTPPPRVLFLWGTLNFAGIVTSLSEDLDYFSPDGMALRAKVSLTITEQNLAFEAMKQGAGARDAADSTAPGASGGAPGSSGTQNPVQAALAQAGESIQQLLSRLDADPAAWRTAMNGLDSPLGLAAGAQVQLAASASLSAGVGVSAGFAAGAEASADGSLGAALGIDASAGAGLTAGAQAGFALAAGGGIDASYNRVAGAQVGAAVASARASFQVPAPVVSATAAAGVSVGAAAVAQVDARAISYGAGLPLRPRAEVVASAGPAPWQQH
jgi:hypothetical protein